ncbi:MULTISPECIES: NAD-dependent succinate-semialdehyde dehydrogenase [Gordonia]|uniref:NAD-dependent succinate-semialdehyde dehydrogenase n=1 Tax=Gordonia polyisoprenivorans TaxID=84595 RepID=A0A846WHD4_9ACTN|nr:MULTISPECIES: NAD-dependent succinate-semialdehyde dehydrogenase [Gordonia]MDF3283995.1 NAD-dependent succinate-semialdehyde dehydrogenase [Gordonia sp. N1V]NKY00323.1 NAD-dependent succinate-semialdehyde dehydrogenase [Gordonia polyisoprenivorans]QUD81783.1 NAD-dependent succinate-semialdehyde dehydrogenase [Gordonia polyisoprenivorans]WCB38522.1 NAD-dependent succinate-semialdehyde dehydrogenase [Gordonia polyisoprenivorans]
MSTTEIIDTQAVLDGVPTGLWIGGESVDASDAGTFTVYDPATEQPLTQVADATVEDARRALDVATSVADDWAATPARERGEILRRAFGLVADRTDDLAMLMTLELGRALPDSLAEARYGNEFLRWFAEEAVRIDGRFTQSPAGTGRIVVTHAPVGPCLAITPWNFPLAMGTRKIGPALAAGNVMLVKPAHETPLTMLALAEIFAEAGLPAGVLSVLPTMRAREVASAIIGDDRIRKISFTGSTPVGKNLLGQAAERVQRTSMELGGNAPFVVFDDADVDKAVEGAFLAKMRNGGEACTAANRFLVQSGVVEEFTEKLVEKMSAVRIGPGYDDGVTLGPLVSAAQRDKVAEAVETAVAHGGRVRLGGKAPGGKGFFYPATVIDNVDAYAPVTRGEIFGPVAVISSFDSEDEAIKAANSTEFGLAAYFFTRDLDRALRVSTALDSGMVGVNRGVISDVAAPFGGVKESGIGREGGSEGIEEYLTVKYIAFT